MEIIQERLEREYDLDLLATAPSVEYDVTHHERRGGLSRQPGRAARQPDEIAKIEEPWMDISIITPARYIGAIMELVTTRRGEFKNMDYIEEDRVLLTYRHAAGRADRRLLRPAQVAHAGLRLARLHLRGVPRPPIWSSSTSWSTAQPVDALSLITHRDKAYVAGPRAGREAAELIPRQMFDVPIQAAIGSRIIARETIRAMRKNVLAKCYGGDVTRKRKLLEKQTEGKKRMKRVGNVEIPQEAFMAVLSLTDE